ncbi:MAG TPA: hypothetical protein VLA12_20210 [Planctomycetaceae bacterium]|nr:hypothetical protein [Planctomycetaceae bacterium]
MRTALLCSAALLCATVVSAQEKSIPESDADANQLPASGTWVKYQINHTNVFDNEPEKTKTLEIKFLDRVMIDDHPHRWIEFRDNHQSAPDDDWTIIVTKYLLPESAVLTKPNPFRLLDKRYQAIGKQTGEWYGGGPQLLTRQEGGRDFEYVLITSNGFHTPLLQGLKSRRKMSRSFDDEKTVPYQRGNVKCTNRLEGTLQGLEPDERAAKLTSWDADYQLWLSDQVPLGIAEGKIRSYRTEYFENPKRNLVIEDSMKEIYLIDFGTGAKSALPDSK